MSPVTREIVRGVLRTLFYYLLILGLYIMWQGGLFIYEGF